jgi:hypothetical protein
MTTYKYRYGDKPKRCSSCGKSFLATRRDAKYCSDACRKRASRRDKPEDDIVYLYNQGYVALTTLAQYASHEKEYSGKANNRCKSIIIQCLHMLDDDALLRIHEAMDERIRDIKLSRI